MSTGTAVLASAELFRKAHGMRPEAATPASRSYAFRNDPDHERLIHYAGVHEGKGAINIKFFFRDEGARPSPRCS